MDIDHIRAPIVLQIPSDPAWLFLVRCLVEKMGQRLGLCPKDVDRMVIAVDEALSNVIRHAYGGRTEEKIVLTFVVEEDRIEVRIRDFGPPPRPGMLHGRDLGQVRPGGLGVPMIKAAMDDVILEGANGGGCLLRLIKYRKVKLHGGQEAR